MARAVLAAIGIPEITARQVTFDSLIPGSSALTAFLVPTGNPSAVQTFEDVAEKNLRIAVLSAAVEQGYAESSGVPVGNIQSFPDQNARVDPCSGLPTPAWWRRSAPSSRRFSGAGSGPCWSAEDQFTCR